MSDTADMDDRLTRALRDEFGADELSRINLLHAVSARTLSAGSSLWRHVIRPVARCVDDEYVDVTGLSSTGADGRRTFRLRSFTCNLTRPFGLPVNVVATPVGTTPCFLTVERAIVDDGADVEITVASWDPAGAPVPNVAFDWRCRVVVIVVIL